MRFSLGFAAVLLLSATASRAGGFDLGTVELSGTGSIATSTYDGGTSSSDATSTIFTMSPAVGVYLAPFINVGPLVNWELTSTTYKPSNGGTSTYSYSLLDMGGKVGFIIPWSEGFFRPLPFIDLGSGLERRSQDSGDDSDSESGGFVQIGGGIKLKIGECFYLSLSQSFSHQSVLAYENQFRTAFGFSGLIGH